MRTDEMYLGQTLEPGSSELTAPPLVLRHYAFADEWFKLNATFNVDGDLVETGPAGDQYAVNCDVAMTLIWAGSNATAVDLFLDVLVLRDGSYRSVDRPEFEDACSRQLISSTEAACAEAGLTRLLHWITSGRLHDLITELPRYVAGHAPPPLPFTRSPLAEFPALAPYLRPTW